ncbi:MAG: hypothetical protein RL268_854 [Pseudomonadota bacterium]|jgi:hypothetical protein
MRYPQTDKFVAHSAAAAKRIFQNHGPGSVLLTYEDTNPAVSPEENLQRGLRLEENEWHEVAANKAVWTRKRTDASATISVETVE